MTNPLRCAQTALLLTLALALTVAGCSRGGPAAPEASTANETYTANGVPAGGGVAVPPVSGTDGGPPGIIPTGWRALTLHQGDFHCQAAVPAEWSPIVAHAAMLRQAAYAEVFPVNKPDPSAFETWAREQGGGEISRLDTATDPMVVEFRVASSTPDNTRPGATVVVWRKVGEAGCGLKVALTDEAAARMAADLPAIIASLGRAAQ